MPPTAAATEPAFRGDELVDPDVGAPHERSPCGRASDALEASGARELLAALEAIRRERDRLDEHQDRVVHELLGRGVSWAHLGAALGVTRQAAHKRYASRT